MNGRSYKMLSPPLRSRLLLLISARTLFFALLIYLLDYALGLETRADLLSLVLFVGTIAGGRLAFSPLSARGMGTFAVLGPLLFFVFREGFSWLFFSALPSPFLSLVTLGSHLDLLLLLTFAALLLTFLVVRHGVFATVEVMLVVLLAITTLAGHRFLNLNQPKIVVDASWYLGISPLLMFVVIGILLSFLALLYLSLSHQVHCLWLLYRKGESRYEIRRPFSSGIDFLRRLFVAGVFGVLFFLIGRELFERFSVSADSRLANGVGQASSDEGTSPLGFHSALGATKQPSALVRLEGDYPDNPTSPLLYLRESALSKIGDNELVMAGEGFDTDITRTSPNEEYRRGGDDSLKSRREVRQSVYLMSDHQTAFGIDFPIQIDPLVNPNPDRFRGAFRVLSLAPTTPFSSLVGRSVGDQRWNNSEWSHYLKQHPDSRYSTKAREITTDAADPLKKAQEIISFLSREAIYTLQPNHQLSPGDDPVAPFLFGDLRGYCVHFAHATVYMLRALGIPARAATGYLTDLSQAKDGHILLRMSDRHAWAEIYISGIGWVPFDTQPEQVESHAETPVDSGLLEELMGLIEPDEEILGKDPVDEEGMQLPSRFPLPSIPLLIWAAVSLIALFIAVKVYLRYGWLLALTPRSRLRASVRGLYSLLADCDFERERGETRHEYSRRLGGLEILPLAVVCDFSATAPQDLASQVVRNYASDRRRVASLVSRTKWYFAFLRPRSVIAFLTGEL